MTLRFEVNQAEAFRRGVNVPKSTCHIDLDPSKLLQMERNLIADRLEGIDVCQLDENGRKLRRSPLDPSVFGADATGEVMRIVASLPTSEALMEAVRENQKQVNVPDDLLQFTVRPLHDSDWNGIHTAQVNDKMDVIHCKAGPGRTLPAVRAGRYYTYRGKYPATFTAPGDTTAAGMPVFSVYVVIDATKSFETAAILMNKTGKQIAHVPVRLWPNLNCGDFHLPSSANVEEVINTASTIQTQDGKQLRLVNVRHCTAVHLMSPGKAHIEFEFEPIE